MTFLLTPAWPVLSIVGPDAATWLNGIITCDVTSVVPGRGNWGLLLSKPGKIQAELQLVGAADRLFVAVSGGDASEVEKTLEHYLVMEDAELTASPDLRFVALYGDGAEEAARRLEPNASRMPWLEDRAAGFVVAASALDEVLARAREAGIEVEPGDAAERLVELGLPRYGIDFSARDNPHEASLERRTVSWTKGCYLGQEVVCMQDMRGKVKRRLVLLEGAELDVEPGTPVLAGDEKVGQVTSRGRERVLASLTAPHFEPGTQLSVGSRVAVVRPLVA